MQVHPQGVRQRQQDRHHHRRHGHVVHEGRGNGNEPDEYHHRPDRVAPGQLGQDLGQTVEQAGLFQAADGQEQADEKAQGLPLHLLQQDPGILGGAEGGPRRQDPDGGHGQARQGMGGDEQHDGGKQPHPHPKDPVVRDGVAGVDLPQLRGDALLPALELVVKADVEIHQRQAQPGQTDDAVVLQKVPEAQAQRRPQDDVGRVAGHGGRAPQVGGEDLPDDEGHRGKAQILRQPDRRRHQEEDHRHAVHEHGQQRRQDHKAQQNGHGPEAQGAGQAQADPVEEAGLPHALHQHHHAGEEKHRAPVDAHVQLRYAPVGKPEPGREEAVQAQSLQHRRGMGQQQQHQHPAPGAQGDQIARAFVPQKFHK